MPETAPQESKTPTRAHRRGRRVSIAVTAKEERALRWKARVRGLWNPRRKKRELMVGPVLRDQSLAEIVREYDEALITPI